MRGHNILSPKQSPVPLLPQNLGVQRLKKPIGNLQNCGSWPGQRSTAFTAVLPSSTAVPMATSFALAYSSQYELGTQEPVKSRVQSQPSPISCVPRREEWALQVCCQLLPVFPAQGSFGHTS